MTVPEQRLRKLLRASDTLLLRLTRLLSTPSGIDSTLCTLQYTLAFVHSRLAARLSSQLAVIAESVAQKASEALLPGEALIASIPSPPATTRLVKTTEATKKLADLISDYRIFVRLWGLLGIYAWGRGTWTSPPKDKVVKAIVWAQVAVNALYQVLENGAYLASHGVLNSSGWQGEQGVKRQTRWWVWSSRFWAAHVGLEFGRLGYVWWERSKEDQKQVGLEKEDKLAIEAQRREEDRLWWNDLVSNAAYGPLTIHWSLEEGCVSESWVGLLGAIAGGVGLREKWRATA